MQSDKFEKAGSGDGRDDPEIRKQADRDKYDEYLAELKFLERRPCWRGSHGQNNQK